MAKKRGCGVVESSRIRSCLFVWTFVAFFGVISGRLDDDFRGRVTPKSPTTCGRRPDYCMNTQTFHMPWGCEPNNYCYANYNYTLDTSYSEKSEFSANLSATIFYRYPSSWKPNTSISCIQVLNLTWTVRLNDSNLPVVGFKLVFNRFVPSRNFNKSNEVFFFIKREKVTADKNGNTMFYFDCLPLSTASQYRFELFSLHSASDRVPERLARSIGVMSLNTDCDIYPDGHFHSNSKYKGYIHISEPDKDCSITVYFSPAPDSFKYSGYNVHVMLNDRVIMKVENLPFTCKNYEPVFFKNIGPGNYRLQVVPIHEKCPCSSCTWCAGIHQDFNISESNSVCTNTTATSVSVTSASNLTAVPSVPISSNIRIGIQNQNVIIAMVTFIVAAVAFVIIFMILFKSRKCKARGKITVSTVPYSDDETGDYGGEMPRQPVLLVYASDNQYHNNVVQCLATYLHTHCNFDVRFDQWFLKEISKVSALDWILNQLRSVQNVIVINSEGGFRHYEADTRGVAYERIKHETPLENMFLPAIRELRNEYFLKPKSRKLFKVAFPYTGSEFVIGDFQPGITYRLMTHIEDLFLNIHDLTKHSRRGKTTVVGINEKDYARSPEGHELEKAIGEACDYFRGHPDWFSSSYQEKPRKDENIVCTSMNKDWNTGCLSLKMGSSCMSSPACDSGVEMSIEFQNMSDSFLKMLFNEDEQMESFSGPELDDVSSLSSANLELRGEMLNKDFDSTLEPLPTLLPSDFVLVNTYE